MTESAAGEKPQIDGAADATLSRLAASVGAIRPRGPAPVHLWHPAYCGAIDMRISADGTWHYQGSLIRRDAMVRLFAGILRKDSERFVLVTPVECVGIEVEDAPFVAVAMEAGEGRLRFVTNVGDEVEVDAEHPLRFQVAADEGVKPYVLVRGDLWARLTRTLAIDLLDRAVTEASEGVATVGVRVGDAFFPIAAAGPS